MRRRFQILRALGIIAVVLLGIRMALPTVIARVMNDRLQHLQAYRGHVGDVDLAVWRGAYSLRDVRIVKVGNERQEPFFTGDRIDVSTEWRSLLHGRLVAEGVFYRPVWNLIQAQDEKHSQTGKGVDWVQRFEQLYPFEFNTVRVQDGTVTFRAPGIRTEDALKASRVDAEITNITNVVQSGKEAFATFDATGTVLETGSARVQGRANPWARQPTFDLNVVVKNVKLPEVNPWLRKFIKADAESGDFELYTELAAADGRFKGYAKPIMHDVKVLGSEEKENPLRKAWEALVQFASKILENDKNGQIAARIPFSGTIEDPHASIFQTVVSVLHNAFVSAFTRSLEGSISLRSVQKSLDKYGDDAAEEKKAGADERLAEKSKDKEEEDKAEQEEREMKAARPKGELQ